MSQSHLHNPHSHTHSHSHSHSHTHPSSHPTIPSNTSSQPTSSTNNLTSHSIKLYQLPFLQSQNFTNSHLLKYQFTFFIIMTILLLSNLDAEFQNLRIVIYCILFLLFQFIRTTSKTLQLFDPLQLSPIRKICKQLSTLLQINLVYLLFRILFQYHNIYSFLLFVHFSIVGVMNFQKNKKNYEIKQLSQFPKLWKILTPLLLFIFSVIINRNISEISFIQLVLLSFNLVLTIEIKLLLIGKQCYIFGWQKHVIQGKNHLLFNKQFAIKKIFFSICAAVALQNLFFILPTMNQYASFTMFHSLVLGGYIFHLYNKERRSKQ